VYQYATGASRRRCLVRQILHEESQRIERYLKFLSSSSSGYSIDLLKEGGRRYDIARTWPPGTTTFLSRI
jgi:oligoendopeptidase F